MKFRPMQSWHRSISIIISLRSESPLVVIVEDLNLPLSLQCGGFQNFIQTVVLWFSSGGTKSHLHRDMLDNINCLLDGKKEIIFIDKVRFIVHLYWYMYERWIPLRAVKVDGLVVDFYPTQEFFTGMDASNLDLYIHVWLHVAVWCEHWAVLDI